MAVRRSVLARLSAALFVALTVLGVISAPAAAAADDASISGTVRSWQASAPIGGVAVSAYLLPDVTTAARTGTTAGDGSYSFTGLAAGTYKVRFIGDPDLYSEQWYYFADDATGASAITLASGDQDTGIDGYLPDATTSISGTVRDSANIDPLQGVTVNVYAVGDLVHAVYSTPTRLDGTYEFTGVAPGAYKIHYSGDPELFVDQWYGYTADPSLAPVVTVTAGSHQSGVDGYLLDATTSLAGTLRRSDNIAPLAGATVKLYTAADTTTAIRTTTTTADGSYSFTGLATGTYKVLFTADQALFVDQWYGYTADPDVAWIATVTPGSHQSGVDGYLLDATTSLAGTLRRSDNIAPLAGATVKLYTAADTTTAIRTTTTTADGSYSFTGLATGTYKVLFTADQALFVDQWYGYTADPDVAWIATVTPGSHQSGVDGYLLDATTSLAGTVHDANAQGLKGATVDLFRTTDTVTPILTTTSAGNGSYRFTGLAAGSYLIRFSAGGGLFPDPQWYSFAPDAGSANEVMIARGTHRTSVDGYLTPTLTWDALGTATISGTPAVGSTLTATPGSWSPAATSFQYQWFVAGDPVGGATAATFVVPPAAANQQVEVSVTGVKAGYPTVSTTATVNIPIATLTPAVPTISGTARVGSTLAAAPGSWGPAPVSLTYAWNGGGFLGTGPTLVLPDSALGQSVTVTVTGHRDGYTDVARSSTASSPVLSGSLSTATPIVTGTPAVGAVLSADPGTWSPSGVALTYQWKAGAANITGATGSTLLVPASALGQPITVAVTGTRNAYTTATTASTPTANIALGTLTAPTPTITGTAVVGGTLTAAPGPWRPYPVAMSYQWSIGGVPFSGATGQIFVIPGSAAGKTITVSATGSKTAYSSVSRTSAGIGPVTGGGLSGPTPTITGTARVGSTLTANPGTWTPAPVTLAFQWKSNGAAVTGATSATLVVPAASLGQTITVTVTGTKTGYTPLTTTSATTSAVSPGVLTAPAPGITGTAQVGATLTVNTGTWGPDPVALTYQWKSAGTNIAGATGTTLVIPAGSLGQTITVTVTGTKTGYTTTSQTSLPTAVVTDTPPGTLTTAVPTITGTAQVGATLTANPGTWGPAPVALTYQWKSAGTDIAGATGTTLVIPAGSLGQTITVTVTGTKTGYTTASQTSAATGAVVAGILTAPTPTITGTPVVDGTLTAVPGTWAPAPVALTYQWKANGISIIGATAGTLALTPTQLGQTITVTVTGTKIGYTTTSKDSTATAAVAPGTLTAPTPTISGTAQEGATLTAAAGVWTPAPVALTYQWKSGGNTIAGATGTTLVVPAASVGQTITVTVTGTKTGYTTASQTSAPTGVVTGAPPGTLTTAVPTITGTAQVDATLTTNPGTWGPAPVTLTYQWKSAGNNITGATGTILVVPAASVGQTITVTVTGTKTGYTTASQTSVATAAVTPGTLTAPTPTITGTAQVGGTLTATPGTWGPAPVDLTYQWKSNGAAISGATAATLVVPAASLGQTVTVTVTGTKTGYTTASKDSAPTAAVTPAATGSISGLVVETDSTPASGIDICLFHQEGDISTRDFQDVGEPAANGSYSFTQVPAGRYVLLFITSGSLLCNSGQLQTAPYWPQWYRWGNAAVDATPVLLTAAAPDVNLQTVYMTAGNGGTDAELFAYAKPTISGTAAVGQTLTAAAGSWFPAPTTVTRQWNADGVAIPGATGGTFVVTTGQQGKKITVTETASGTDLHTTSATSDPTATVPVSTLTAPIPTITGTAKVGSTLTAHPGTWAPAPVNLAYAWKAGGVAITGVTGSTLVVPAAALSKTITVTVTGTKSGYTAASRTSAPTATVLAGTLTGPTPTISGTAKVGYTLTAHAGTWNPSPVTLKYQWKINGANISGATASTYKISASYVGKTITVTVTGSKTAYTTLVRTSASTAAVVAGTLTAPTPKISGTAKVGYTLTAKPGTWGPAPVTLRYQWRANGASISGATAATYKIAAAAKGKKITVTVTGTKTGYTTAAKTSGSTATVAAGTLTAQTPSISGRAKVGVRLTANPGTWSPGPVTLTYRWRANGASISGATAKTFVIPTSAKGKKITVTVTGTKAGYTTAAKTSSPTATVT